MTNKVIRGHSGCVTVNLKKIDRLCAETQILDMHRALTIVRHAHGKALVETTVLALIPVLFLDLTVALTFVILQLQAYGSSEEALETIKDSVFINV